MSKQPKMMFDASAEAIWDVLVGDFVNVHKWMASIDHSTPMAGTPVAGAPAAGRNAHIPLNDGIMADRIVGIDAASWTLHMDTDLKNIKGFNPLIGFKNSVYIKPVGKNRCEVTWTLEPKVVWFLSPMYFMLKKAMFPGFIRSLEELKHISETGQPHPRKVAAFEKEGVPVAAV
jgi:hypothetical protein